MKFLVHYRTKPGDSSPSELWSIVPIEAEDENAARWKANSASPYRWEVTEIIACS